jgi:hypothetical protein
VDNQFSLAMNASARLFVNDNSTNQMAASPNVMLWLPYEMPDPSALGDQTFRMMFPLGVDTDDPPDPSNSFTGGGRFYVSRDAFDASGSPRFPQRAEIVGGILRLAFAGLFEVPLTFTAPPTTVLVSGLRTHPQSTGRFLSADGAIAGLERTWVCGVVLASSLHDVHYQFLQDVSVLDAFAAGFEIFRSRLGPLGPDFDLDGDGIESFSDVDGDGAIDLCRDGDGMTEIPGRDCPFDPRIADGYSFSSQIAATRALLAGVQP